MAEANAEPVRAPEVFADAASFVRAIHAGNYDAAAVFADWLEERGDERGVLLRRRWKRWRKEREAEFAAARAREEEIVTPMRETLDRLRKAGWQVEGSVARALVTPADRAGPSLRRYVQRQFPLPEFAPPA